MIKWQEVVTSRCKTNNTRPQTQTWTGFTTHIGDSVRRSLAEGIFSPQTLHCNVQQPPQTLQCSETYFLFSPHVWSCSLSQSSHLCCWGIGARRETHCLMWGIPNFDFGKWEDFWQIWILVPVDIILVPRRQLTLLDSESNRNWKHGVRSKYIVRPSAVEEVLLGCWFFGFYLQIFSTRLGCTV